MARPAAKKAASGVPKATVNSSNKAAGKTATNPNGTNRVSKPATGKATLPGRVVDARTSKEALTSDETGDDMKRYEKLLKRGPKGPPIYDSQGFELDFKKVSQSMRPISKRSRNSKKYMKMLEDARAETKLMEGISGVPENGLCAMQRMAIQDRVARDLGVPYHKVGMEHYARWSASGFKADPDEFKVGNISEDEGKRLLNLACGSALRK
jgi:hypothetical protein